MSRERSDWDENTRIFDDHIANQLSGYYAIQSDLQAVREAVPFLLNPSRKDTPSTIILAGALITYRRCFASGDGSRLDRKLPKAELDEQLNSLHLDLLNYADKLAAHRNGFAEFYKFVFDLDINGVSEIGLTSLRLVSFSEQQTKLVIDLVDRILDKIVFPKIRELSSCLETKIRNLNQSDLHAMPQLDDFLGAEVRFHEGELTVKNRSSQDDDRL